MDGLGEGASFPSLCTECRECVEKCPQQIEIPDRLREVSAEFEGRFLGSVGWLIKKLIGLSIFQAAVFLLYITMGKVDGGTAPIFSGAADEVFSNPLPQVLILTAIVVGISTTALGLGIVVRIKEEYGSIEEDEIQEIDRR